MTNNNIVKTLALLGLSKTEAVLYLGFINEGPSTIAHMATTLNMERTAIYPLLHKLIEKGLVNEVYVGLKKKYQAISPKELENIVQFTKVKIGQIIPELTSLYERTHEETEVSVLKGITAIKNHYELLLKDLKPNDFYYVISNSSNFISADPEYFESFIARRAGMQLDIRLLLQDTEENKKILEKYPKLAKISRVFYSKNLIAVSKTITPQHFSIHQTVPPVHIITTTNKNIIEVEKNVFEQLWGSYTK